MSRVCSKSYIRARQYDNCDCKSGHQFTFCTFVLFGCKVLLLDTEAPLTYCVFSGQNVSPVKIQYSAQCRYCRENSSDTSGSPFSKPGGR